MGPSNSRAFGFDGSKLLGTVCLARMKIYLQKEARYLIVMTYFNCMCSTKYNDDFMTKITLRLTLYGQIRRMILRCQCELLFYEEQAAKCLLPCKGKFYHGCNGT